MFLPKHVMSKCVCLLALAMVVLLIAVYPAKLYYSQVDMYSVSRPMTMMVDSARGKSNKRAVYGGGLEQGNNQFGSMAVRSVVDEGSMTVAERSKFQRSQVDKFCAKYNLTSQLALPNNRRHPVYEHLLVNNVTETLFCYVPKVGCTHLKLLYLMTLGLLPTSMANTSMGINKIYSEWKMIMKRRSISLLTQDNETCDKFLKDYTKFVMYRNPLERLVSGFKDKVQGLPLKGLSDEKSRFNWLKKRIYKHTHPQEYEKWSQDGGLQPVWISFPDFITYWLKKTDSQFRSNKHFKPIFDICVPCNVRYDYYGDFETFDQDSGVLAEMIGADPSYLRQSYYSGNKTKTSSVAEKYYSELTEEQKVRVLKQLSQDIDFYYHLFPIHKDSHKRILNITNDLFVP